MSGSGSRSSPENQTTKSLPPGVTSMPGMPAHFWPVRAAVQPLHPLFAPMEGQYVYFAHSFAAPASAAGAQLLADPGRPYCAALARGNLFAVQFHPEKSQQVGLAFLQRFVGV